MFHILSRLYVAEQLGYCVYVLLLLHIIEGCLQDLTKLKGDIVDNSTVIGNLIA